MPPSLLLKLRLLFEKTFSFLKKHENIGALVFYILTISVVYSPVVFFGKSFQFPIFHPDTITENGAFGYQGRKPFSAFNVDMSSATGADFPTDKFIGEAFKKGSMPFWNPFKGVGEPLLEQLAPPIFFPYQILKDLTSVVLWDFFLLGRLLIAGFFSFLFFRTIKVSRLGSLLGGLLFMLSGTFSWFLNNELMVNPAMIIPIVFWAVENLIRGPSPRFIIISVISTALLMSAGPPTVAVYVLLFLFSFYLFRIFFTQDFKRNNENSLQFGKIRLFLVFLLVFLLALGLVGPIFIPFLNFLTQTVDLRSTLDAATHTSSPVNFGFIIFPGLSELNVNYRGVSNGIWDDVGSYVGIVPIFLIILGLVFNSYLHEKRGIFFFFLGFGLAILFKNFGFLFFNFLGKLPVFNMVWSQRWGGPSWTFGFIGAAVLSFDVLRGNYHKITEKIYQFSKGRPLKYHLFRISFIVVPVVILYFLFRSVFKYILSYGTRMFLLENPSFLSLFPFFAAGAGILFLLILLFSSARKINNLFFVVFAFSFLELWLWIPRGYQTADLRLLPFVLGICAILFLISNRLKIRAPIFVVLFLISFSIIDYFSPFGLPSKFNPLNQPPFIDFLKKQGGYFRIIGTKGLLNPNFSSAFGLFDFRYHSGTVMQNFYDFRKNVAGIEESPPYWFFNEEVSLNSGFEPDYFPLFCPQRHLAGKQGQKVVFNERLPFYSLLGIKYILTPFNKSIEQAFDVKNPGEFPLVYNKEIKIYENPYVLPRAFVAPEVEYVNSYDEALEKLKNLNFADFNKKVFLEENVGTEIARRTGINNNYNVKIKSYSPNGIAVEANSPGPGVLVLTDLFYPGWEAKVNGEEVKIFRVNGLFRGVPLRSGHNEVIFKYLPPGFNAGLIGASLAILGTFFLVSSVDKKKKIFFLLSILAIGSSLCFFGVPKLFNYLKNGFANKHLTLGTFGARQEPASVKEAKLKEIRLKEIKPILQGLEQSFKRGEITIENFQFPRNLASLVYLNYKTENGRGRILIRIIKEGDPEYEYNQSFNKIIKYAFGYYDPQKLKIKNFKEPLIIPPPLFEGLSQKDLWLLFYYWEKDQKILERRVYIFERNGNLQGIKFEESLWFDCETATWKGTYLGTRYRKNETQ